MCFLFETNKASFQHREVIWQKEKRWNYFHSFFFLDLFCFTTTVPHFVDMTSLLLLFKRDDFIYFSAVVVEKSSPAAVNFAFAVIPLGGLCVLGDVFQL